MGTEDKKPSVVFKNYSKMVQGEARTWFFEKFARKLINLVGVNFGLQEKIQVAKLLQNGTLSILNPEGFFFSANSISDNSYEIFNTSKDLEDFFFRSMMYFRERAESGETNIIIREFFIIFIELFSKEIKNITEEKLDFYLKYFFAVLVNASHPSPFTIQLLEPHMVSKLQGTLGIKLDGYGKFFSKFVMFFRTFIKQREILPQKLYFPNIEMIFPIYTDVRDIQLQYLSTVFKCDMIHVNKLTKHIRTLSEDTPILRESLNTLSQEAGIKTFKPDSVIIGLQRIEEELPRKTYTTKKAMIKHSYVFQRCSDIFKDSRIKRTFIALDDYEKTFQPFHTDIIINCYKMELQKIEQCMDVAKMICLSKQQALANKSYTKDKKLIHKITLVNVERNTNEFINFVRNKIEQIKSISNKEFIYEVRYTTKEAMKTLASKKSEYIRVISDIHEDYNQSSGYNNIFNFGDDFVINCGDTAGNYVSSLDWIRTNMIKGVVVPGNHLGYSPAYPELDEKVLDNMYAYGTSTNINNTRNFQIQDLGRILTAEEGQRHNMVRLLSNSEMEYEGIIILGTTLYTDFRLYGEHMVDKVMNYAQSNMNDYKLIKISGHREYVRKENGEWNIIMKPRVERKIRTLTPNDHAYYFTYSFNFLKEKVLEYKNKPIIVVTHHAPSEHSIHPRYQLSMLNPAFASNLNKFIIENPNIRLWCHGHVHNSFDYILGKTRVVCEPLGYGNENRRRQKLPFDYGKRISIKDIKSKIPWKSICKKEIEKGLIKVYED